MNGVNGSEENTVDIDEDIELKSESEDTVVLDADDDIDNVGDISVEINVEELVAKIESDENSDSDHKREIRQRLDKLNEERDQNDEGTFNFNLDEDL
jgi:hypothetical protein